MVKLSSKLEKVKKITIKSTKQNRDWLIKCFAKKTKK